MFASWNHFLSVKVHLSLTYWCGKVILNLRAILFTLKQPRSIEIWTAFSALDYSHSLCMTQIKYINHPSDLNEYLMYWEWHVLITASLLAANSMEISPTLSSMLVLVFLWQSKIPAHAIELSYLHDLLFLR
jgi:hypothetical protein